MFADGDGGFEVIVNEPELEVQSGDDARLTCNSRGNQAKVQRIEWTRDGKPLPLGISLHHTHIYAPHIYNLGLSVEQCNIMAVYLFIF